MKTEIITRLEELIADNCKPVDREERFAESLDAEGPVNVAGLTFNPSQIWREMDPTAFRCGVNDYADSEDWCEVDGEYYEGKDCDEQCDSLISELESEVEDLETEIEEEEREDEPNLVDITSKKARIDELNADIATLNKWSF